jgi:hypothetical protein
MLLLVKQRFVDRILDGSKTFEIRFGRQYRKVKRGDYLCINGWLRLLVDRVETHSRASLLAGGLASPADLEDCYAGAEGPFYVFHFNQPEGRSASHPRDARGRYIRTRP